MLIYKWTNNFNLKIYVGKTTRTLEERIKGYKRDVGSVRNKTYSHKHPIVFALHKYGMDNFTIEVIDTALNNDDLNAKEKMWIEKLDACNRKIGYNITKGGDDGWLGRNHTQATKDKISKIKLKQGAWVGSKNPKSKLTKQEIINIIKDYETIKDTKILAIKYKVSASSIRKVLNNNGIKVVRRNLDCNKGKTWKLVDGKRIWSSK